MNKEDLEVVLSDKEYIEKLEKEVYYQNKEVTRLNNIINELEKYLYERRLTDIDGRTMVYRLLDKLKELKENK